MNKEDFNNFQIFNGTGTAVKEKPMTNSKLDRVAEANKDALEHYRQRNAIKKKTTDMIQQMRTDIEEGEPYSLIVLNALTIIEQATGEALLPKQLKKAVCERETVRLNKIAKRHHEEATAEGRAVIAEYFDMVSNEITKLGRGE